MTSLIDSLYLAQRSLSAQQYGLEVTQQNIANVNKAGATRQRVNFIPGEVPPELYQLSAGTGISGVYVDSFRNKLIDMRINMELQGQERQSSIASALSQIDAIINESGGNGLQGVLSDFSTVSPRWKAGRKTWPYVPMCWPRRRP
ncbi:MAG: hypothetical protein MZW92_12880 [Comamonadaceae bacterium]|nr:hypothetical protein [Comamonadaceae bacterium]